MSNSKKTKKQQQQQHRYSQKIEKGSEKTGVKTSVDTILIELCMWE